MFYFSQEEQMYVNLTQQQNITGRFSFEDYDQITILVLSNSKEKYGNITFTVDPVEFSNSLDTVPIILIIGGCIMLLLVIGVILKY
mmetsp:Transcript_20024/g.23223  ORF Transcript_20024/g.23223 Transcript_20024/m.23223 type:complete len:86 (-) Transcript_20024:15-272(-)